MRRIFLGSIPKTAMTEMRDIRDMQLEGTGLVRRLAAMQMRHRLTRSKTTTLVTPLWRLKIAVWASGEFTKVFTGKSVRLQEKWMSEGGTECLG